MWKERWDWFRVLVRFGVILWGTKTIAYLRWLCTNGDVRRMKKRPYATRWIEIINVFLWLDSIVRSIIFSFRFKKTIRVLELDFLRNGWDSRLEIRLVSKFPGATIMSRFLLGTIWGSSFKSWCSRIRFWVHGGDIGWIGWGCGYKTLSWVGDQFIGWLTWRNWLFQGLWSKIQGWFVSYSKLPFITDWTIEEMVVESWMIIRIG